MLWEENRKVDALAEIATTFPINGMLMLLIYLKVAPSITPETICNIGQTDLRSMFDIIKYLQIGDVPKDRKQAHKLRIQATRFTLINDQLYKRSLEGSYLKCLSQPEVKYVLAKLHEGVCENHPGRRTLAQPCLHAWTLLTHQKVGSWKLCHKMRSVSTSP